MKSDTTSKGGVFVGKLMLDEEFSESAARGMHWCELSRSFLAITEQRLMLSLWIKS